MSTRRSHAQVAVPPGADDFQRIRGVGAGVAQRLYSAGILSFAQLADLTPQEIAVLVADIAGLSTARINTLDWVGKAHQLALEQSAAEARILEAKQAEPQAEVEILQSRQHYSAFKVEFLLNEENELRRTKVTHVLDGAEGMWAGWHQARLSDFFIQHARLHLHQAAPLEPAPVIAEAPSAAEHAVTAVAAPAAPAIMAARSALSLRAIDVLAADADTPQPILRQGQPFAIRLTLAFVDGPTSSDPLDYTATVYAKSLEAQGRHTLGQMSGSIKPSRHITLSITGKALPPGIFRLEAFVTVGSPQSRGTIRALCEGGLIQVL